MRYEAFALESFGLEAIEEHERFHELANITRADETRDRAVAAPTHPMRDAPTGADGRRRAPTSLDGGVTGSNAEVAMKVSLTVRKLGIAELRFYGSPRYIARRGEPRDYGDARHEWVVFGRSMKMFKPIPGAVIRFTSDNFVFIRELLLAGGGIGALQGLSPRITSRPEGS